MMATCFIHFATLHLPDFDALPGRPTCLYHLAPLFAALLSTKGENDADSVNRAVAAPVADMSIATESAAMPSRQDQPPHPPLPPTNQEIEAADGTLPQAGAPGYWSPSTSGQSVLSATDASTAAAAAASFASPLRDGSGEVLEVIGESVAAVDDGEEQEESIENLLGSLVRALNTTQGRADFGQLIAESADN